MGVDYLFIKVRKLIYVAVVAFIIILFGGCDRMTSLLVLPPPTTIADIAYDTRMRRVDYRVYIEENSDFVPYLVATSNYNGNVLLVREFLLDDAMHFNPSPRSHNPGLWGWYDFGAYYEGSYIDSFLNSEFISILGGGAIGAMVLSNIEITDKSSMGVAGRLSTHIQRYVFLLSLKELGGPESSINVPEGERLDIFAGKFTRRVARLSDGEAYPYWTRSPSTWGTNNAFVIGANAIDSGPAHNLLGVRPAFAVYRNTPITTRTDIVDGEYVFVIDERDY